MLSNEANKDSNEEGNNPDIMEEISNGSYDDEINNSINTSNDSKINVEVKKRKGKCIPEINKVKKEEIVEASKLRLDQIFGTSWQQIIKDSNSKKMPRILKEAKYTLAKIHYERNETTLLKSIAPAANLFEKKYMNFDGDENSKSNFVLSIAASVRSLDQNEKRRIKKIQDNNAVKKKSGEISKILNINEIKVLMYNDESKGIDKLINMVEERHQFIRNFLYAELFNEFPKLLTRTIDLFNVDSIYFNKLGINFEPLYIYHEKIWKKMPQVILDNSNIDFSTHSCGNGLFSIHYKGIFFEPTDKTIILKQVVLLALITKSYLVPLQDKYFTDVLIKLVNGTADYTCKSKNRSRYFGSKCLILEKEITCEENKK